MGSHSLLNFYCVEFLKGPPKPILQILVCNHRSLATYFFDRVLQKKAEKDPETVMANSMDTEALSINSQISSSSLLTSCVQCTGAPSSWYQEFIEMQIVKLSKKWETVIGIFKYFRKFKFSSWLWTENWWLINKQNNFFVISPFFYKVEVFCSSKMIVLPIAYSFRENFALPIQITFLRKSISTCVRT